MAIKVGTRTSFVVEPKNNHENEVLLAHIA